MPALTRLIDQPFRGDVTLEINYVYVKDGRFSVQMRIRYMNALELVAKQGTSSGNAKFEAGAGTGLGPGAVGGF